MGVNRFECRTCPYEAPLEREWFEKAEMKQKEVDDVFGGAEEFANADSVASKSRANVSCLSQQRQVYPGKDQADRSLQLNAPQKPAMGNVRTSSSCRFAVQMSP
jgi:hypothetical protein